MDPASGSRLLKCPVKVSYVLVIYKNHTLSERINRITECILYRKGCVTEKNHSEEFIRKIQIYVLLTCSCMSCARAVRRWSR